MAHSQIRAIELHTLLKEKLIELDLREKKKAKILEQLVELAARSGKLKNKKAFLRILQERERLGSTGIGNGVAIPHAKSNTVRGFVLAFARSREGVDFGALDGERVYLFFLLASPEKHVGEHLKVLARISSFLRDKFVLELLKHAEDKKEILRIIASSEKALKQ